MVLDGSEEQDQTNKWKCQGGGSSSLQEGTVSWCVPPAPEVFKLRLGGHHQRGGSGCELCCSALLFCPSQRSRVPMRVGSRCVAVFLIEIFKD